ncbi:phosphate ABC transporter permease subunit PstC [Pararhizobium mangrovi]|uniref:Phosphate transport system permease protein n=1 Tax=Pararhizobium mangrovi TaxID=2590452 RepID=A0A506U5D3_9HYPH|nr:phosphate ABC transporter permease subunit PstC [Pararhizobium mangrovi]TPW27769.1 phosphate ABC transporter permease subunit PstC [Pararhizobium mangrovi]
MALVDRQRVATSSAAGDSRRSVRFFNGSAFERAFAGLCLAAALFVLLILGGFFVSLTIGAWPALAKFGPAFVWTTTWNPVTGVFGALPAIAGTLITSAIAIVIAVPLAFAIAIFITQLAPEWLRQPLGVAIELLAAIPSIIYGMWGLFVFAPVFRTFVQAPIIALFDNVPVLSSIFSGPAIGIGMATAGVVLAIMILPFIAAVMRDVIATVPKRLKESGYAIGATDWEVARAIIIPNCAGGLTGAVFLGLGRALGETMAVTFIIGNANRITANIFAPSNTIASTIANEFQEAYTDMHSSALIALGLLLFVITFIVLALARLMLKRISS